MLPSHREGLSNALLEAQARALPCITTDATGCVDAIAPGESGLVVRRRGSGRVGPGNPQIRGQVGVISAAQWGSRDVERVERLSSHERVWADYRRPYRVASPRRTVGHQITKQRSDHESCHHGRRRIHRREPRRSICWAMGAEVTVLDNLLTGFSSNIEGLDVDFVEDSILDDSGCDACRTQTRSFTLLRCRRCLAR